MAGIRGCECVMFGLAGKLGLSKKLGNTLSPDLEVDISLTGKSLLFSTSYLLIESRVWVPPIGGFFLVLYQDLILVSISY